MFEFFKKLFGSAPVQTEKQIIKESELSGYLHEKLKEHNELLKETLAPLLSKLEGEKKELEEKMEGLRQASLRNDKISMKEKQYMHGNREAYLRKLELFIYHLTLSDKTNEGLVTYCNQFKSHLDEFGATTSKQYMIISHFFANEIKDIAITIKKIEQSILKIRETIVKSSLYQIKDVSEDIEEYLNKKGYFERLGESLIDLEKRMKENVSKNSQASSELKEVESSDEYRSVQGLEHERDEIKKELKMLENDIRSRFSSIDAALRKYSRISPSHERLIQSYLEDPIKAVFLDSNLKILYILEKMGEAALKDELELKDKKKEKTVEAITTINDVLLRAFVNKHRSLTLREEKINQDVSLNQSSRRAERLRSTIITLAQERDSIQQELEKQRKEISSLDIPKMRLGLSHSIKEKTGEDVEII